MFWQRSNNDMLRKLILAGAFFAKLTVPPQNMGQVFARSVMLTRLYCSRPLLGPGSNTVWHLACINAKK